MNQQALLTKSNAGAEASLLNHILSMDQLDRWVDKLSQDHFYSPYCNKVFTACVEQYDKYGKVSSDSVGVLSGNDLIDYLDRITTQIDPRQAYDILEECRLTRYRAMHAVGILNALSVGEDIYSHVDKLACEESNAEAYPLYSMKDLTKQCLESWEHSLTSKLNYSFDITV